MTKLEMVARALVGLGFGDLDGARAAAHAGLQEAARTERAFTRWNSQVDDEWARDWIARAVATGATEVRWAPLFRELA